MTVGLALLDPDIQRVVPTDASLAVDPDRVTPKDYVVRGDELPAVANSCSTLPFSIGGDKFFLFNMDPFRSASLLSQPNSERRWPYSVSADHLPSANAWYVFPTHGPDQTSLHPRELERIEMTTGVYQGVGYIAGYGPDHPYVDSFTRDGLQLPFGHYDEEGNLLAGFRLVYPTRKTIVRDDVHPQTPPSRSLLGRHRLDKRRIVEPGQLPFWAYLDKSTEVDKILERFPPVFEISQLANTNGAQDKGTLMYILSLLGPLQEVLGQNADLFFDTAGVDDVSIAFATRIEIVNAVTRWMLDRMNGNGHGVHLSICKLGTPAYDFAKPGYALPGERHSDVGKVYPGLIILSRSR